MKKRVPQDLIVDDSVLHFDQETPQADCFGVLYDPKATECVLCACANMCASYLHKKNRTKVPDINYFDQVSFEGLEKEVIELIEGGTTSFLVIQDAIMVYTKSPKPVVENWLKVVTAKNGYKIINHNIVK